MSLKSRYGEAGFGGVAHLLLGAIGAVAVLVFAPQWVQTVISAPWLIVCFIGAAMGASLLPDLDNAGGSTAKSRLGVAGRALSLGFSALSVLIQTTLAKHRDNPTPDAHRGFWHTLEGIGILTFTCWGLSYLPYGNIALLLLLLFIAVGEIERYVNRVWFTVLLWVGIVVMVALHYTILAETISQWLWIGVAIGLLSHVIGDKCTKKGTVTSVGLNFLLRDKVWWFTSWLPIESCGRFEKNVLVPLFAFSLIVLSIYGYIR